jgi:lauroyl/myristoyl acyltransferase
MRILLATDNDLEITKAMKQQFQMICLAEWEAACQASCNILKWPVVYEGLEETKALLKEHRSLVFVSGHFASSILGCIFLQRIGIPITTMTSNVIEDPRLQPNITTLCQNQYSAWARYFNGGQALHREGNTIKFARFLKNGGALVIYGDMPGTFAHKFLGSECGFASGPVKFSKGASVPLLAFVCEHKHGTYHLRISKPNVDPYKFLEEVILENPSAWWASDQLPYMQKILN